MTAIIGRIRFFQWQAKSDLAIIGPIDILIITQRGWCSEVGVITYTARLVLSHTQRGWCYHIHSEVGVITYTARLVLSHTQ